MLSTCCCCCAALVVGVVVLVVVVALVSIVVFLVVYCLPCGHVCRLFVLSVLPSTLVCRVRSACLSYHVLFVWSDVISFVGLSVLQWKLRSGGAKGPRSCLAKPEFACQAVFMCL